MTEPTCENCKWWYERPTEWGVRVGSCWRFPPSVPMGDRLSEMVFGYAQHPKTKPTDRCGEHTPKEENEGNEWRSISIDRLKFSQRARSAFRRAGTTTIGEVVDYGELGFSWVNKCGNTTLREIGETLEAFDPAIKRQWQYGPTKSNSSQSEPTP